MSGLSCKGSVSTRPAHVTHRRPTGVLVATLRRLLNILALDHRTAGEVEATVHLPNTQLGLRADAPDCAWRV